MENQKEQVPEKKQAKAKKKGKIEKAYQLYKKGLDAKEIAEKMELSVRVIRSYIWRKKNPQAYKLLLARYFTKRKLKKENEAIKAAVKNQK